MKFFVCIFFLLGWQANAVENAEYQKYLKNITSKGKETVAQYLERNKDVLPQKIYEEWKSNPDFAKIEMLPIEVNVVQGKPIFYLRDAKNRQHTLAFKGERNNLFTFDGLSISGADFVDFNAAIKKIAARDYYIRQMIEKPDPQAWSNLFQKMQIPKISQIKTKDKVKFLVYHRAVLQLWLQSREVLSQKQQQKSAQLEALPQMQNQEQNLNLFAKVATEFFIEQAVAADPVAAAGRRDGDRCVERGYLGTFNKNECEIKNEIKCGQSSERSCNPEMYGKLSGKVKCVPTDGGDKVCGVDILKNGELAQLEAADFSQPSLINTQQMEKLIAQVETDKAKTFALSFLQTTGNPNLQELDQAYSVFNVEIGKAFQVCEAEYKKANGAAPDAKLRESCMMMKKQQVLFAAGLRAVQDPKNPYVWTTEQRESCDNALGYPNCGEPAAAGAPVCYKGVIKCNATGFAVGVGGAALVGVLMSGGNGGKAKNSRQDPIWEWPPKNACDDLSSPSRMWCSDPDKCPLPYQQVAPKGTSDAKLAEYAKANGYCKPPPCSGNAKTKAADEPLTNFIWSYASNGCVETCQDSNAMRAQWLTATNLQASNATTSTGVTGTSQPSVMPPWGQQLNCFNSDCKLPNIWNGFSNACEVARDCTQPYGPFFGISGTASGSASGASIANLGLVLADHNQCIYPPCERGQERDWMTGTCTAYGNFQKCPNTDAWVTDVKTCDLYFPQPALMNNSSGGSR